MQYENESKKHIAIMPITFFLLTKGENMCLRKNINRPAGLLNLLNHLMFATCLHRSWSKNRIRVLLFILYSRVIHVVFLLISAKYRRNRSRARRAPCFFGASTILYSDRNITSSQTRYFYLWNTFYTLAHTHTKHFWRVHNFKVLPHLIFIIKLILWKNHSLIVNF
jgi:hypothetical protein